MAKQQQQKGGGGGGGGADNALTPLWIILGIGFLGWAIWHYFHEQIVIFAFQFKLYQAYLVNLFNHNINPAIQYIHTANPQLVSFDELVLLSKTIGHYTRFPIAVILILLSAILYFSNIALHFRKAHSMNTLRKQEQQNWPQIKPNIDLNLIDENIGQGPWASAQTPVEFCKHHNLLEKRLPNKDEKVSDPQKLIILNLGKAKETLTLQLGRFWEGHEHLKDYEIALFAIFAARANRDNSGAGELLGQINNSFNDKSVNFAGSYALLRKHINTQVVQEVVQCHAYIYTVFSSLLERSRETGVLASADFLWLKPIDRTLWYVLNNVGRQTAFVEVAGIFCHWTIEKKLGFKSLVPMVDEAVKGLATARDEVKLNVNEF